MDPQERIFLETAWAVIEDAGYTRFTLCCQNQQARAGIFVGVTTNTYQLWGADYGPEGHMIIPRALPWSIANRISYILNFQGPSVAVDTACSSSLVALHMACESLKREECQVAIAGGVNLYLHPSKYIALCQSRMLSRSGKCRSFGQGDEGFVPGEGVGAVLLKPIKAAEQDGDHIYGVIQSTAINHGGDTGGYTIPNPDAQAALIQKALQNANLQASSISYVEAHGTGTALGDPIEIRGLSKAFKQENQANHTWAVGSVKSNIGHLEAAAGIAALTKVLLQFQHKQLAPSLYSQPPNPNINFAELPFCIPTRLSDWQLTETSPLRRAGISSFGVGGANAHVIVEEYPVSAKPEQADQPGVVVLSAANPERLKIYAQLLHDFLLSTDYLLPDIVYTLASGREIMHSRLAIIAQDKEDLKLKLAEFLEKGTGQNIYRRDGKLSQEAPPSDVSSPEDLARLWVSGIAVDQQAFYPSGLFRRIPLPTYPFAKESHWINTSIPKLKKSGPAPDLVEAIKAIVAGVLFLEPGKVESEDKFVDLGVDSILGVEIIKHINTQFRLELPTTQLYDSPSIADLAGHLQELISDEEQPEAIQPVLVAPQTEEIAVIGMAGRFPGARDLETFWNNLAAGHCSVQIVPSQRWPIEEYFDQRPGVPNKTYCKWGGFIEDIERFDSLFFSISPAEAEAMDPQQRIFLEEAWRALEDAGYAPDSLAGSSCGVFVGAGASDYLHHLKAAGKFPDAYTLLGTSSSILAARISYFLGLTGPSMAIDTACSSSLVAIHQACRSILDRESEIALAGGVCILNTPDTFIMTSQAGMLAPDGRCKVFDDQADGFVPAEGVGVVILKSLERAQADHDHIYGIIKGSAINQDGSTNGITAPSPQAQANVQQEVYKRYKYKSRTYQLSGGPRHRHPVGRPH